MLRRGSLLFIYCSCVYRDANIQVLFWAQPTRGNAFLGCYQNKLASNAKVSHFWVALLTLGMPGLVPMGQKTLLNIMTWVAHFVMLLTVGGSELLCHYMQSFLFNLVLKWLTKITVSVSQNCISRLAQQIIESWSNVSNKSIYFSDLKSAVLSIHIWPLWVKTQGTQWFQQASAALQTAPRDDMYMDKISGLSTEPRGTPVRCWTSVFVNHIYPENPNIFVNKISLEATTVYGKMVEIKIFSNFYLSIFVIG